jgi:hypothetical protein
MSKQIADVFIHHGTITLIAGPENARQMSLAKCMELAVINLIHLARFERGISVA